jgi:hypothetical protein
VPLNVTLQELLIRLKQPSLLPDFCGIRVAQSFFLYSVLWIFICSSVLCHSGIILSVLRFTSFDYDFKPFLYRFRENQALQFLEQSVIIGDSPNKGEVAMVNNNPVSIGRSFPMSMKTK